MKQIYWSAHEGRKLLADGFVAAEDDRSAMERVAVGAEVGRVLKPGKWCTLRVGVLTASVDGPQDAGRVKDTMGWGETEEAIRTQNNARSGGHLFEEPKKAEDRKNRTIGIIDVEYPTPRMSPRELQVVKEEMAKALGVDSSLISDAQVFEFLDLRNAMPQARMYGGTPIEQQTYNAIKRIVNRESLPHDYHPWCIAEIEHEMPGYQRDHNYRVTIRSGNPKYAGHNLVVNIADSAIYDEMKKG